MKAFRLGDPALTGPTCCRQRQSLGRRDRDWPQKLSLVFPAMMLWKRWVTQWQSHFSCGDVVQTMGRNMKTVTFPVLTLWKQRAETWRLSLSLYWRCGNNGQRHEDCHFPCTDVVETTGRDMKTVTFPVLTLWKQRAETWRLSLSLYWRSANNGQRPEDCHFPCTDVVETTGRDLKTVTFPVLTLWKHGQRHEDCHFPCTDVVETTGRDMKTFPGHPQCGISPRLLHVCAVALMGETEVDGWAKCDTCSLIKTVHVNIHSLALSPAVLRSATSQARSDVSVCALEISEA